jgi:AcrR family transcriptional regulator
MNPVTTATFQRARSDEQRAERSRAILATAASMLAEMPVADVSLNELSRRVGLAKSNVLRYFESREAVLLNLLNAASTEWLTELTRKLRRGVDPSTDLDARIGRVTELIAKSVTQRPVLCDLLSAQSSVLERNISTESVVTFKRAARADLETLAALIGECLPELRGEGAMTFVIYAASAVGALWTASNPADAVVAAYIAEPDLSAMRIEFEPALRQLLRHLLSGIASTTSAK